MYSGRRPALIPSSVHLSVEDRTYIKDRTGRSPFPPPDAAAQDYFPDGQRKKLLQYKSPEKSNISHGNRPNRAPNEDSQMTKAQASMSQDGYRRDLFMGSHDPSQIPPPIQESADHWPENKRTTYTQRDERRFSADVPHASELGPPDKEIWQVSSSPAHFTHGNVNPFNQPRRLSANSMRLPIPHSGDTWQLSSIYAISPRDTSMPKIWGA